MNYKEVKRSSEKDYKSILDNRFISLAPAHWIINNRREIHRLPARLSFPGQGTARQRVLIVFQALSGSDLSAGTRDCANRCLNGDYRAGVRWTFASRLQADLSTKLRLRPLNNKNPCLCCHEIDGRRWWCHVSNYTPLSAHCIVLVSISL